MKFHIKKGDFVEAISGRWRGARGKVVSIVTSTARASVEFPRKTKEGTDLPYIKKAARKTQDNPQGGFLDLHPKVHVSNLKLVDEKDEKSAKKKESKKEAKKK